MRYYLEGLRASVFGMRDEAKGYSATTDHVVRTLGAAFQPEVMSCLLV